ncbi:DUF2892 domain-containing protein [Bacillus sp. 03113]|uniref:YgaP family membrane protein n=1 Tax=Bacillus sp. 03113 TaxID=2578211 RepID=UPI001141AD6D|nr:DUF2892 domain-containing protein [Bacillus sp. 03113]
MNIKPNIGLLNALIRITIGFTILAWSTSKLVKRPWRESYLVAAFFGGMKIAEGIVRFCPMTALFERSQEMMGNWKNDKKQEDEMTYNPS